MDTSKIVGEKIKSLRESQSISMEELAQRSGLAIEQIERIENNIDLPSLAPLIKIARVLGVRLGTFLDDQDENGPVVCRKDESQNSISFSNNAIHSRKHMEYHSLSKSKADRHMEPVIIDVAVTAKTPTCSKKVTASITIPSFRTTYTPMKGRQPRYLQ